jgi:hypothetical protein
MSPIYTYPNSSGSSCPCDLQKKYYYHIIDPPNVGCVDMTGWSINGNDFILGVNIQMTILGGSGIALILSGWQGGEIFTYQRGYLAFYGDISELPTNAQMNIKDCFGNDYFVSWSPLYGGNGAQCDQGWADFPQCIRYTIDKTVPFLRYLEVYWYDQYMWNADTGYPLADGVPAYIINFANYYGTDLDLNDPSTPNKIKFILDGMFLNNTTVSVIPISANKIQLFIQGVYCNRSGIYDLNHNKWIDGSRDTINC